jgi:hypothetical protein
MIEALHRELVTSSIYGTSSYILSLQRGLVHGTIAGKRRHLHSGSLHSFLTLRLFCPQFNNCDDAIFLRAACSSNIAGVLQPCYFQSSYVYVFFDILAQ